MKFKTITCAIVFSLAFAARGKVYELPDGSKAEVKYGVKSLFSNFLEFNVVENSCGLPVGQACKYNLNMYGVTVQAMWKEHQDTSKIGRPVKFRYKTENNPGEFARVYRNINIGIEGELIYPNFSPHKKLTDSITCKDWKWLPKDREISIPALFADRMFMNFETNVNENRGMTGAYELALKKVSERERQIVPPKYYESLFFQPV